MIHALIVGGIVVAIALGYKTNLNTGLFGIMLAYILGAFVMGLKTSEVIGLWPTTIFFVYLSVSLFFGMAGVNGTLKKVSQNLVYACRKTPVLIPYAIFFGAWVMAAMGVSVLGSVAFMAPIALALAEQLKMDKFAAALCVNFGVLGGADFITGGNGLVFMSLLSEVGYADNSTAMCLTAFVVASIYFLIVCTGYMLLIKGFDPLKKSVAELEKPEPMNREQRITLGLIAVLMLFALGVPILKTVTGLPFFVTLNSRIHIGLLAVVLTVVGLLMKAADQKKVFAGLPWNTIVMLCGVGMLVNLAVKAGTVQAVGAWIGSNLPAVVIPAVASLLASFMSFFASAGTVECPALFPVVPTITAATGITDVLLITAIIVGAQSTAISPFSTCGSTIIASCSTDEDRNYLFKMFIARAVPLLAVCSAVFFLVVCLIF